MPRARRLYFLSLSITIALLVAAVWISQDRYDGYALSWVRFVVISVALAAAAATWGTAVMIASVHRRVWPLIINTITVGLGIASTATFWHLSRARGW